MNRNLRRFVLGALAACVLVLVAADAAPESSVKQTIEAIVARLYATLDQEKLLALDEQALQGLITDEERSVLARRYWYFDVNVPVTVSVMRHVEQATVPFWLPQAGFKKTEMVVKNEEYTYEVWQKDFPAGRVELGINGFDKHRQHYFVAVGPQEPGTVVTLSNIFPSDQVLYEMRPGATIYHDWSELVLTEVPKALEGQVLLPTIRGRAREAHLIQAFRQTPFPSGAKPDHIMLTWSDDPRTTQTIQWRTNTTVPDGMVRFKEKDAASWSEVEAERVVIDDLMLANDRRVHRFTAVLRRLKPGTTYTYMVGSPSGDQWSEENEFITAPDGPTPFSFVFLSDTHNSAVSGQVLTRAFEHDPQADFFTVSGDLVGTGQYRSDWDQLFEHFRGVLARRPFVPSIGNHDVIDGLGADMYLASFALPTNGPKKLENERAYSFEYSNALFLILDSCSDIKDQTQWLEDQLAKSKATWKFAVFHFPPYSREEDYPEIRREWGTLFDRYHVDIVLSGHVHRYMRTHPLKAGKIVASPAEGTIYMISVAVPRRGGTPLQPEYAAAVDQSGLPMYQWFSIDGNRLVSRAYDIEGAVCDELIIEKSGAAAAETRP